MSLSSNVTDQIFNIVIANDKLQIQSVDGDPQDQIRKVDGGPQDQILALAEDSHNP